MPVKEMRVAKSSCRAKVRKIGSVICGIAMAKTGVLTVLVRTFKRKRFRVVARAIPNRVRDFSKVCFRDLKRKVADLKSSVSVEHAAVCGVPLG